MTDWGQQRAGSTTPAPVRFLCHAPLSCGCDHCSPHFDPVAINSITDIHHQIRCFKQWVDQGLMKPSSKQQDKPSA